MTDISSSFLSSFYLPNNTTVCTSTSIQFRRAGQQDPTRTLTAALKRVIKQLLARSTSEPHNILCIFPFVRPHKQDICYSGLYTESDSPHKALNTALEQPNKKYDTIRYDTRCYFNVRSKADTSQLNLPHGTNSKKVKNRKTKKVKNRYAR